MEVVRLVQMVNVSKQFQQKELLTQFVRNTLPVMLPITLLMKNVKEPIQIVHQTMQMDACH